MQPALTDEERHHASVDPHVHGRWLPSVLLGAQDGLVNTLGVLLGVAAATQSSRVVIAAGFAAAIAESISMAAVAYTSSRAQADLFESERAREYRHLAAVPRLEREEVRQIYARKGFDGELLERVVETVCKNADVWVSVMMAEEHGLSGVPRRESHRSAAIVGVSSLAASVAPVLPFLVLSPLEGVAVAMLFGVVLLFALGALAGWATGRSLAKSGFTIAAIGLGSAAAAYAIGAALGTAR